MVYPLLSEYIESILSPKDSFDELKWLRPVLDDTGQPVMSSGNFAVVFKMEDKSGKQYALKCFLRDQKYRDTRYQLISKTIERLNSPYFVTPRYLENELFVDTKTSERTEFPVVMMEWVDGITLDNYIRNNIHSKYHLDVLAYDFGKMAYWLYKQPIAHGDLKPDNILVKDDGRIVLVDYDGMYIPSIQDSGEKGSPDFQHPNRAKLPFDEHIDDFSLVSILLSLTLIANDASLYVKYATADRLLFSYNDYVNPEKSHLLNNDYSDSHIQFWVSWFKACLRLGKLPVNHFCSLGSAYSELRSKLNDECLLENAYIDEKGVRYSNDRLILIDAPKNIDYYEVIKGTALIAPGAFKDCLSLSHIELSSSIRIIGKDAFLGCKELESVVLPFSLEIIEDNAFEGCVSMRKVIFNERLLSISNRAFHGCQSLESLYVPNSVDWIGQCAFQSCERLQTIQLPNRIFWLPNGIFANCKSLVSVAIPEKVNSIGDYVFDGCRALRIISFPKHLDDFGRDAFRGCVSLSTIVENDQCIRVIIDNNTLIVVSKDVTEYIVPENITSIRESAFEGCTLLRKIQLNDCLTRIGDASFRDCCSLGQIRIPDSVETIGKSAFEGCSSLHNVTLPASLNRIKTDTFNKCSSLEIITIPEGVESIADGAFAYCAKLSKVGFPKSLWGIGNVADYDIVEFRRYQDRGPNHKRYDLGAFEGCTSLYSIQIPSGLNVIGDFSFFNCTHLMELNIPDSIEYIGDNAFFNCACRDSMIIPDQVGYYEYDENEELEEEG